MWRLFRFVAEEPALSPVPELEARVDAFAREVIAGQADAWAWVRPTAFPGPDCVDLWCRVPDELRLEQLAERWAPELARRGLRATRQSNRN